MADVPKHLALVSSALVAELKRQQEQSGPYGALHYLSVNDEGEAHVEGSIDLAALTKAVTKGVLDAQAELIPHLKTTEGTLEKVKAGLRALYQMMLSEGPSDAK